jgi:hypothetical protein
MQYVLLIRWCLPTSQHDVKRRRLTSSVFLGGVIVIVLAIGPKVRGFKPGRARWIFKGGKSPQHTFLRKGSEAVGPMSNSFRYVKEVFEE